MHILCLSLNHQTAGVGLRERLAFNEQSVKAALARLSCGGMEAGSASELVILSTCNRVEIFASAPEPCFSDLEAFLADARGLPTAEFHSYLLQFADEEAVSHLLRVASGLEALVLGEAQILGQVVHALELAQSQGTAGPVLSRLFQAAIHAGKRARTESAIGHNPASVSSIAVHLANHTIGNLAEAEIGILGAGEMAELTVEAFRKRGVTKICVVNRTLERARALAERWDGQALTFERLLDVIESVDILVCSTGAPHTLIDCEMMLQALPQRGGRRLLIIDIAVPRDVDPPVGELEGVTLFDIDTLQEHLQVSLNSRKAEVPIVEAILVQEKAAFMKYMASLEVLPLIAEIRQNAETVRQNELRKTLRRMPWLGAEELERIDSLTNALVKKILQAPLLRLRSESGGPDAAQYAEAARALFGLENSQAYLRPQNEPELFGPSDVQGLHSGKDLETGCS